MLQDWKTIGACNLHERMRAISLAAQGLSKLWTCGCSAGSGGLTFGGFRGLLLFLLQLVPAPPDRLRLLLRLLEGALRLLQLPQCLQTISCSVAGIYRGQKVASHARAGSSVDYGCICICKGLPGSCPCVMQHDASKPTLTMRQRPPTLLTGPISIVEEVLSKNQFTEQNSFTAVLTMSMI